MTSLPERQMTSNPLKPRTKPLLSGSVNLQDLKTFHIHEHKKTHRNFASGFNSDGMVLFVTHEQLSEWLHELIDELVAKTRIGNDVTELLQVVLAGLMGTEYDQESFKTAVRRIVIEELEMSADTKDIYCHLTGADIKVEFPEEEEELTQSTGVKPGRVEKMKSFAMVNCGRGKMCFLSEDGRKKDTECIKKIRTIVHYKFDRAVGAGIVVRRPEFFLHDVFESIMHKQFCLFTLEIFRAWIDHCIADDLVCHIDTIKTLENVINYD